jgi:hypothetical protein
VSRAIRFAAATGDASTWLEPAHYLRALIATGAYNPVESVLAWCVKNGHLTTDELAADLARLSGQPAAQIRAAHSTGGTLNAGRLASALRPFLFREKDALKSAAGANLDALRSRASRSLFCAARFKQAHTGGYLDKVVRYKAYFETRS